MLLYGFLFALAATLGAALRYGFTQWVGAPWGTLLINLLGSLLMGFLFVYLNRYSPALKVTVCVAFLGAMTTYSSFSLDMVKFMEAGAYSTMGLYFLLSNIGAILGCYMGFSIAQKLVTTL